MSTRKADHKGYRDREETDWQEIKRQEGDGLKSSTGEDR